MPEILGGEVVIHPPPKGLGTKREHASHDVKMGYGGNDVTIQGEPLVVRGDVPRGYHGNLVQSEPGNIVQISQGSRPKKLAEKTSEKPLIVEEQDGWEEDESRRFEGSESALKGEEEMRLMMDLSEWSMGGLLRAAKLLDIAWQGMTLPEMNIAIVRGLMKSKTEDREGADHGE